MDKFIHFDILDGKKMRTTRCDTTTVDALEVISDVVIVKVDVSEVIVVEIKSV
jgi:hypothetical protein